MVTITQEQQDSILELKAKLKFVENQLEDLQNKKNAEIETENTKHKDAVQVIVNNYAAQINGLQNNISTIQSQLNEVK